MKRALRVVLIALLLTASASTAFGFEWISLSEPDASMSVSASVGYGSLLIIPVGIFPAGARFEMGIPGIDNLYAGAGFGYLGIDFDDDGDTFDYTLSYLSLSAYAKYIVFAPTPKRSVLCGQRLCAKSGPSARSLRSPTRGSW